MSASRLLDLYALDLFAGPGGWDEGIRQLGITPLGIEWDEAACLTRDAAGHKTLRADVSELDPRDFSPCELLIASPPCQAFSTAGKGDGRKDIPIIMETAKALGQGRDIRRDVATVDSRSLLVVEPLRFALALRPRWIAFEQVPPVLSLWKAFAHILRAHGYGAIACILSAEQYGVPQTRDRSFLMASLDGTPEPPRATHQPYEFGVPAAVQHTFDGVLAPWVSMADALGWGLSGRPSVTVAAGSGRQGGHDPLDGGSGSRATIADAKARGLWVVRTGANTQQTQAGDLAPYERSLDAPAPTIDTKTGRSWTVDRPAPTLVTTRRSKDGLLVGRQMADGEGENVGGWGWERPAATIAGDSRVFQPGGHHEPGKQSQNAVRVTLEEAAILQSFQPDYPFQGSRTKQFEQVGNAVPPLVARRVISALTGVQIVRVAA